MSPVSVVPQRVPAATVRRLTSEVTEGPFPVQRVAVQAVAAPRVVPRQLDPVARRLMALQLENDDLRVELADLRTG